MVKPKGTPWQFPRTSVSLSAPAVRGSCPGCVCSSRFTNCKGKTIKNLRI
ncbi:MAG: hypothetical protein ACI3X6_06010 [Alloprevotella sp.]